MNTVVYGVDADIEELFTKPASHFWWKSPRDVSKGDPLLIYVATSRLRKTSNAYRLSAPGGFWFVARAQSDATRNPDLRGIWSGGDRPNHWWVSLSGLPGELYRLSVPVTLKELAGNANLREWPLVKTSAQNKAPLREPMLTEFIELVLSKNPHMAGDSSFLKLVRPDGAPVSR